MRTATFLVPLSELAVALTLAANRTDAQKSQINNFP